MARRIDARARRKLRARRQRRDSIWFGLGMFGVVGWSVAIPTVIGLVIGLWLDARFPGPHSWTLMMLVIGLGLGSLNAWYWLQRERQTIEREERDNGE